ncbi:MAG TPA: maleylpyruvate isomerase family mycothiol-dependent enzyme [Humibacter sp.]|nr:maleylpyruvate isomerase family mycothiol-dependent enzyme [Humibacter sp.]
MATMMTIGEHVVAIRRAAQLLGREVQQAGEEAPVPSCPGWDARALLAHIVMVHDWAGSHVRGEGGTYSRSQTELRSSGDDLFELFDYGVTRLVDALLDAPDDLDAMVFLKDAPRPRAFWARRQAHETTIHSIDALAARLGRLPSTAEAQLPRELALDGIDELLMGFVPRGKSRWHVERPFTLSVCPSDSDRRWRLQIDAERVSSSEMDSADSDARFSGTAAALYLGLWNRGAELVEEGSVPALEMWRTEQRVRWS